MLRFEGLPSARPKIRGWRLRPSFNAEFEGARARWGAAITSSLSGVSRLELKSREEC